MSFLPSERAKAAGAPVEVDIGKIEPGQKIDVEWRGKVVWIINRTQADARFAAEARCQARRSEFRTSPQQPPYCKNEHRSIKDAMFVAVGICTHLGCSPTFRPEVAPADLGPDWLGGFFCPCHQSKFDLAGRVYKGVPAPTNLVIPPYKYLSDTQDRHRRRRASRRKREPTTMQKILNWIDDRFPLTALWESQWGKYVAPKNFNFWYYFGSLARVRAGDADRHRHLPHDELQARRDQGVRVGRVHHARRLAAAGSSATCIRPARRCSSSSSTCTCSAG